MSPKGIFTVSLDFELHWGVFDKKSVDDYREYFLKTRSNIDLLLSIFKENGIHVTWATVGALGLTDLHDLDKALKEINVTYKETAYNPTTLLDGNIIGQNEDQDPFHFASSLIEKIKQAEGQEMGSHTFSHFYTLEQGSSLESYRKDLQLASEILSNHGTAVTSLVFPRNQYSDEHLKIAFEEGIRSARVNPKDWFWKTEAQSKEPMKKKVFRTLDHYFRLGKDTTYALEDIIQRDGEPALMPASRFLRPPSTLDKAFGRAKVKRICNEMTYAAKQDRVYHLWWHPHNFSVNSDQSFDELNQILNHFQILKSDYGMQSLNMAEVLVRLEDSKL